MDSLSIRPRATPRPGVRIGTSGWAIPKVHAEAFPNTGIGLTRYASVFNATEINSTFYSVHRPSTYERWHDSVPDDFRFSVKVPKSISHEKRLVAVGHELAEFASSLSGLGHKLGPLLLQLPPKLVYDEAVVRAFLDEAGSIGTWPLVIEPRHATWFESAADALLEAYGIARMGADPERASGALRPGGARSLTYLRLHGSPRVYFSSYDDAFIGGIIEMLDGSGGPTWCIFDNTASVQQQVTRCGS